MKEATVKKRVKNLVIACLSIATINVAVLHAGSEIKFRNEPKLSQTYELQQDLGVTNDYRFSKGHRLQNNNGNPIYVSISKEFTDDQKAIIIEQLDHIFDLLGDINDFYKYELVDNVDDIKYFGKCKIKFHFGKLKETVYGSVSSTPSPFNLSSKGPFIQKCNITISNVFKTEQGSYSDYEDIFPYTIAHELLHCLGINDVYKNKQNLLNTLINTKNSDITMVSPSDYKLLLSMYSKKIDNAEEKEKQIEILKEKFKSYSQTYYQKYCDSLKESFCKRYSPIYDDIDITFKNVIFTSSFENKNIKSFKIRTLRNRYTITVLDKDEKAIEICQGKLRNIDGILILENVNFKTLDKDKETLTDLVVALCDDGSYRFRTPAFAFLSLEGKSNQTIYQHII